jgi:hypothetical protein
MTFCSYGVGVRNLKLQFILMHIFLKVTLHDSILRVLKVSLHSEGEPMQTFFATTITTKSQVETQCTLSIYAMDINIDQRP